MTEIINSIGSGIVNRLCGSTNSFKTAINDMLFYKEAPQNKPGTQINLKPPYCVYDIIEGPTDKDSVTEFYSFTLQFNIYSLNRIDEALTISNYLNELLKDAESSLSFEGYIINRIDKLPTVTLPKTDNVHGIVISYKLQIQN